MKNKVIRSGLILVLAFSLLAAQNRAFAQDTGAPALRTLSVYTAAGGGGGIALGIAYWMLDPLDPDRDFRLSVLNGMGVGFVLGFIFGAMQLNQQAILPYEEEIPYEYEEEAQYSPLYEKRMVNFGAIPKPKRRPGIPLIQFQYRF
ncbi:MAG: hypothetical protein GY866_27885 [Proteobacteria bacterium]|nr:hypothetical protein [Pseudomonadota bacterium]